ncbi:hypothetical protein JCM9534A_35680 [Catenuloplanes indicus JCM 9534]
MLSRFTAAYTRRKKGEIGPRKTDALAAVIGDESSDEDFWTTPGRARRLRWYRYLFLGRSKPSSHLRALSRLTDDELREGAPKVLVALIKHISQKVGS